MPGDITLAPFGGSEVTAGSISAWHSSDSISAVTPPGLRILTRSAAGKHSTVLSTPQRHSPPSIISGILPFMSFMTCWAVVGLGLPDRFADGAASGNPQASIIALAAGLSGILTATVSSPPLVAEGIMSDFGKIIVSGPGQYFSAIFSASSGISRTSGGSCSSALICTISGLSWGRPLASNMLRTAASLRASAANP